MSRCPYCGMTNEQVSNKYYSICIKIRQKISSIVNHWFIPDKLTEYINELFESDTQLSDIDVWYVEDLGLGISSDSLQDLVDASKIIEQINLENPCFYSIWDKTLYEIFKTLYTALENDCDDVKMKEKVDSWVFNNSKLSEVLTKLLKKFKR